VSELIERKLRALVSDCGSPVIEDESQKLTREGALGLTGKLFTAIELGTADEATVAYASLPSSLRKAAYFRWLYCEEYYQYRIPYSTYQKVLEDLLPVVNAFAEDGPAGDLPASRLTVTFTSLLLDRDGHHLDDQVAFRVDSKLTRTDGSIDYFSPF
jgi:hypothetical protein